MPRKKSKKRTILKASKYFTHTEAGKFTGDLKSALKNDTHTIINLTEIESVDLTSLQLLASAKNSFEKAKIPLEINLSCNQEVFNLIKNCGFENTTKSNPVF